MRLLSYEDFYDKLIIDKFNDSQGFNKGCSSVARIQYSKGTFLRRGKSGVLRSIVIALPMWFEAEVIYKTLVHFTTL